MKQSRALVQWKLDETWRLDEIELDAPKAGEVLVRIRAAGLCHTDHQLVDGGYAAIRRPLIPGHEGAGVVEAVGAGVTDLSPGDHVLLLIPVPACGLCPSCVRGRPYFCDEGRHTPEGFQIGDRTARHHARGEDLSLFVFLGTFAEHTIVHETALLKIDPSIPFEEACTIGCAGVTGWGAVQNTGRIEAGDSVVVVGVGGVGANSIMAARYLGAKDVIAIDPLEYKREQAIKFGADTAVATFDDASRHLDQVTFGRGADLIIMAMGVGDGQLLQSALSLLGKRGRCVIVNVHPESEVDAHVSLNAVQSNEWQILGCFSGSWHGRQGASFLLDLHRRGLYQPGKLVSRTYSLDEIDRGYADQTAGLCVRAVVINDA